MMAKTRFDAELERRFLWRRLIQRGGVESGTPLAAPPAAHGRRARTPLQLAKQRRNAQKSTGPRTRAGRRRAALNSTKWVLCSKLAQYNMALEGQDPFEYRRLHRQLIFWFQPWDGYSTRLVAELAKDWWAKLHEPKSNQAGAGTVNQWSADFRPRAATNRLIESDLEVLMATLALRTRKWSYLLRRRLGENFGPFKSAEVLRRRIGARLKSLQVPAARVAGKEMAFLREEAARMKRTKVKNSDN